MTTTKDAAGGDDFAERCQRLLLELGLISAAEAITVKPLTGGVASDIALITTDRMPLCVKFALGQLKVAETWLAPVHRNKAEYRWLQEVGRAIPEAAPRLYGRSDREGGFAMEYVSGPDVYLWKTAMLAGAPDRGEAAGMGEMLGRIHAASVTPGFDRSGFDNADDFSALRLEPYLRFTATRHPDLAEPLGRLFARLHAADTVLVHGDVSPKNILFRGGAPILLDAECATLGDASFDIAFCLNHLVLKALHVAGSRDRLLADVLVFWDAYRPRVGWEDPVALERRVCELLPALMLGRVDGKSPVEYLDMAEQQVIRDAARPLLLRPVAELAALTQALAQAYEGK